MGVGNEGDAQLGESVGETIQTASAQLSLPLRIFCSSSNPSSPTLARQELLMLLSGQAGLGLRQLIAP